jgi:hypothetical protein
MLFFVAVILLALAAGLLWSGQPLWSLLASVPAVLVIIIVMLIDIGTN